MPEGSEPPIAPSWDQIPEHFYRYRPVSTEEELQWLIDAIERRRVYWAAPSSFNDPFDCAPRYVAPTGRIRREAAKRAADRLGEGLSRADRRRMIADFRHTKPAEMQERVDREMPAVMEKTAVYSLTTEPTNILMWSHYARSHTGVCIRLNGKPLFRQFKTGHWITYADQRPRLLIGGEPPEKLLRKLLFTKAKEWEYEQEWRLVDYLGNPGIRTFQKGIFDGIILGSRVERAMEQAIVNSVARAGGYIELLKAVEDPDQYHLNLRPLGAH